MYLLLSIFVIASLRLIPSKLLTTNYNNRFYSKIQKILNLLSLKHTFYNNGKLAAVSLSIPQ